MLPISATPPCEEDCGRPPVKLACKTLRKADHESFHRTDSSGTKRPVEDAAFSDEFCRFLYALVPNVSAAELLLELRARGDRGVLPRSNPDRLILEGFVRQGIAAALADGFVYRAPE